ncbi:DUF5615 family PIN-like protein [candidate division KSB1 bacterium]|nr:DUF5615 family PIN-like protein [candidate division KSB1 bacterium]
MKVLVDENIPNITVNALRKMYNDVKDVRGTSAEGIPDTKIWELVEKENRLLISTDKGFAQYRNMNHNGILIILLKKPNKDKIHQRVVQTIQQFSEQDWKNTLVIVRDQVQSIWKPAIE